MQKEILIIAGGNGVGKTTFARFYNTDNSFKKIAAGEKDKTVIIDENLFGNFFRKRKIEKKDKTKTEKSSSKKFPVNDKSRTPQNLSRQTKKPFRA